MSDFVQQPLNKKLNTDNLISRIEEVQAASGIKPSATVVKLDEISIDSGDSVAGTFFVVDQSNGQIRGYLTAVPREELPGYYLAFFDTNGVFQFGIDADTGKATFAAGAVTIGSDGILADLLSDVLIQTADDGTTYRRGRLGMFTLPGASAPSFGLRYADNNDSNSELVTNGDFETGDFTGWTAVSGTWSIRTGLGSGYDAENTNGTGEKKQIINTTAGALYRFGCSGKLDHGSIGAAFTRVLADFYSAADGGGTLVASFVVGSFTHTNATYSKVISAPAGSASVVVRLIGNNNAGDFNYFDNISVKQNSLSNAIFFEPADGKLGSYMLDGGDTPGQIPVGDWTVPRVEEAKDKLTATPGASGNVDVGTHYAIVTYVDQYGETDADLSQSTSIVISTSAKTVALSAIPLGLWGTVARKVYVTAAGATQTDPTAYKLLTTIGDNTTTTATYNTADANLGTTTIPTTNTTRSRPIWSRYYYAPAFGMKSNATLTKTVDVATYIGGVLVNTAAANANDGDYFILPFVLEAGTYTLKLVGVTNTNYGKTDTYIDGVLQSGASDDWYSAAGAVNVEKTRTVTVTTSGYHILMIKVNGQNASSTDYRFGLIYFELYPTAF